MQSSILRLAAFAAVLIAAPAAAQQTNLADHASGFLAALNDDQRDRASWAFADPERLDIHFAPMDLDGLRHGGMEGDKHRRGEDLLAAALSADGFDKLQAIRLLERDVRALEAGLTRPAGFRDPGRYYWAFFGEPSAESSWGFRYEGHHLSLNVTAVPGEIAATLPLFLGAQPREVPAGLPSAGVAALGAEETLARALYASFDDVQRASATLPFKADRGHMIGQVPTLSSPDPIGLPISRMNNEQQVALDALLGHFASFWNTDIAAARRAEIDAARHGLHFAFVAKDDPPFSFYARIQGPGVLLEMDNTQGGDHVHAVWHRPGDDFGRNLLAAHLRRHHGTIVRR